MSRPPNLFTISPNTAFLDQLAESWLNGHLDMGDTGDPLSRIDTVFYLPTRRAARAFGQVLAAKLGGTALLPSIRTLADASDDEWITLQSTLEDQDRFQIDPLLLEPPTLDVMPALKRRLILTKMINAAGTAMGQALIGSGVSDQPIFPQSLGEASYLAQSLGALIDQVATEESDWSRLFEIVPDDHAAYWQLTLTLLHLVTQHWPALLEDEGCVDAATRRRLLLDARTASIQSGQLTGPVVAAGSTGSIPATARLLAAIAKSEKGAVVLPGLDLAMDDSIFGRLHGDDPEHASHPQHGLAKLLQSIGTTRADCRALGQVSQPRQLMVSHALLPANATQGWPELRPTIDQARPAFASISLLEASSEQEEALSIAMAMKSSLAQDQTVALVTPDRHLARRVQLELQRFDLNSDDSAGLPLRETPPARLMLLAADAWRSGFAAIDLLALLKHPLTALGADPRRTRQDARLLERLALRGMALAPGLASLRSVIAQRAEARLDAAQRIPTLRAGLGPTDDTCVLGLIDRLEAAFAPLQRLGEQERESGASLAFCSYAEALFETVEALTQTADKEAPNPLYAGPAGDGLAGLRLGLHDAQSVELTAPLHEMPDLFEALMADRVIRPHGLSDPRLSIWGPLEARLQTVDHIILGGLNEQAWPRLPSSNPFLSRAMMAGMKLDVPERQIGLSAHDVEQALGASTVTLTRALKVDGTPTVASRWIQRLLAFLPAEAGAQMRVNAAPLAYLANSWDKPSQYTPRPRPEPRPQKVPETLSITEIEDLIRDPYTVYARRVLKLEEAPGLGLPPGAAERGTVFHQFFEALAPHLDQQGPDQWMAIMQHEASKLLTLLDPFPDIQALWKWRFETMLPAYVRAEEDWSPGVIKRMAELSGRLALKLAGKNVWLSGRADRIDLYENQSVGLLDFKTGATPSKKKVQVGLAPQLPLTAAMVARGAFSPLPPLPTSVARYVRVGGVAKPIDSVDFDDAEAFGQLADETLGQLRHLWAQFFMGAPFLPLVRPEKKAYQGRYHHLARVKEWQKAQDEGDG